jgi:enoyl-CoA hydratase
LIFPLHLTPIFSLLLTFLSVGSDKSFAAGADIKEMASRTYVESYMSNMFRDFIDVAKIRKPTIAAVSGFALGGGCELAMMCDIIIASETAKFGQPEIALGVIPGALRRHPSLS